jgi:endogenous inhibitor of DNA gyrase (YacG/DUF329 family)
MKAKCPICKKPVRCRRDKNEPNSKWLPFCSERCKLIDLGRWLDADYSIPVEPEPEDDDTQEENK